MKRILVVTILLGLMTPAFVSAAANGGLESPFGFGAGARELALGGASLYHPNDAYAAYWNPSALALTEQIILSGFHTNLYVSGTAYQYFGAALPTLDYGTFGLGVFRLAVNGIEKRDINNYLESEFDDSRLGIYFSYGRMISGYSFGASISFEQHSLDAYKSSSSPGLTLSAGREFMLGGNFGRKVTLTGVWRNFISPSMKLLDDEISYPNRIEFAAGVDFLPGTVTDHRLMVSTAMQKAEGLDVSGSVGLEYMYQGFASIRTGWQSEQYSFGVGLVYQLLEFDYAFISGELGNLHMFSLSTSFGPSVSDRLENRRIKREYEFNQLMNDRLIDKNRTMISNLLSSGKQKMSERQFADANSLFERALFLARSIQAEDTTSIIRLVTDASEKLQYQVAQRRYTTLIDSATVKFYDADYIGMRYFSAQAVTELPSEADSARTLLEIAVAHLEESYTRDETIQQQIQLVDSLLNYGKLDDASQLIKSLKSFAPDNSTVKMLVKKIDFELLYRQAREALDRGDNKIALTALDNALKLYPGHTDCLAMKQRIKQEQTRLANAAQTPKTTLVNKKLSPEMTREVEQAYETAQQLFTEGKLKDAITYWEQVERLAPNYKSVRDYLIKGYKYVGVELYSQNLLEEAVQVWESARKLDPNNEEIVNYITRTKNEITKMKELSYDFK